MRDENATDDQRQARAIRIGGLRCSACWRCSRPPRSSRRPAAQRPDDSYKGPAGGGGLDAQMRQFEPAPPPPASRWRRWRRRGGGSDGRRRPAGPADAGHHRAHPDRHSGFPRPRSQALRRHRRRRAGRSRQLGPVPAARPRLVPRAGARRQRRAALSRLALRSAPTRSSSATSSRGADGRIVAQFRLWDVATGKQLAGQRFATSAQNWRRVGHIIADQVYEQLDGRDGLLRHARRVRRRDGPEGQARQAPRHHGPGRRQRAAAEPRGRSSC